MAVFHAIVEWETKSAQMSAHLARIIWRCAMCDWRTSSILPGAVALHGLTPRNSRCIANDRYGRVAASLENLEMSEKYRKILSRKTHLLLTSCLSIHRTVEKFCACFKVLLFIKSLPHTSSTLCNNYGRPASQMRTLYFFPVISVFFMVAVWNRAVVLWFLPCFFPRLISAGGDWMSIPYFHTWCGFNVNLGCRSISWCLESGHLCLSRALMILKLLPWYFLRMMFADIQCRQNRFVVSYHGVSRGRIRSA